MNVLTPSTNFIGFIEFYEAIFHAVAAVFHCLLILMRTACVKLSKGDIVVSVNSAVLAFYCFLKWLFNLPFFFSRF